MIDIFRSLSAALVSCYQWSKTRPQSLGYGGILLFGAVYGAGDAIMMLVAVAVIVGGLVGMWRYMMADDP